MFFKKFFKNHNEEVEFELKIDEDDNDMIHIYRKSVGEVRNGVVLTVFDEEELLKLDNVKKQIHDRELRLND